MTALVDVKLMTKGGRNGSILAIKMRIEINLERRRVKFASCKDREIVCA